MALLGFLACSGSSQAPVSENCPVVGTPKSLDALERPTAEIHETVVPDSIDRVVTDTPPDPIGGVRSLLMGANYPQEARENDIEGVVHVSFVVDKQGQPRDLTVSKSVDPNLDQSALEAIQEHRFEPGTAEGRPVCVPLTVPVTFRLR